LVAGEAYWHFFEKAVVQLAAMRLAAAEGLFFKADPISINNII
jgi:hypothetical protein